MPRMMVAFLFFLFKIFMLILYLCSGTDSPYNLFESFSSTSGYQYDPAVDDDVTANYNSQRDMGVLADTSAAGSSAEVKLILLTYMRSGSSFTGDLFNHHPDVFYVYEPLYPVKWFFSRGEPARFLDREPVSPKDLPLHVLQSHVISSFLNCSLHALYLRALTYFGLSFGEKTGAFHRCLKARPGSRVLPNPGAFQGCLPLLLSPCLTSKVIVLKVVRFSMDRVEEFLRSDPKVKVLHLLRDPRATLRSQRAKGMFKARDTARIASLFCRKVHNDILRADALIKKYPGRVILARYEDLADQPMRMSEALFDFAGLKRTRENGVLRRYIWNLTSAGLPDYSLSFTQRGSSRETARLWRGKLEFSSSRVIDSNCEDVYRALGYLPLLTEQDLKNVSVPSHVGVDDFLANNDGLLT